MTEDRRATVSVPESREGSLPERESDTSHCSSSIEEAINFLRWLRPNGPWHLVAISGERKGALEGKKFGPEHIEKLKQWVKNRNKTDNIYFHVNSVRAELSAGKAKKGDIDRVEFFHVDVDPAPDKPLADEQRRIRELLCGEPVHGFPPPSAVIFSGGGFQAFWRLAEPISVAGCADALGRTESYNSELERILGGDSCHNIDRIMRLPGTVNWPNEKKRKKGRSPAMANVVQLSGLTYSPSVFPLPSTQQEQDRKAERVQIRDLDKWGVPERIKTILVHGCDPSEPKQGDNSRSIWLFEAVCGLVRCKVDDEVIRFVITDPACRISESVLENRNPEAYAWRQVERAHRATAEKDNRELQSMNERHAVIRNYGGRTRVMTDRHNEVQFQSVDDFCNGYLSKSVAVGVDTRGNAISKPLARWWLAHTYCRVYERAEFLPGLVTDDGVFNLWRGWPVKARPGDCSLFLAFVRDVICADDERCEQFLLSWMAHAVQRPDEPAAVSVALRGGQGIGKSYFVEHFGELFGKHFVPVTDPKHVVGNFNSMLAEALLVFADEAFAANDKRAEGVLKGLVTQTHITIEPKGVNAFKARKFLRLVLASNHAWMVPADTDDRRFLVLDVSDVHKRDGDYFAAIEREWSSGGREALMEFLQKRDITSFDHRQRPETRALADQKVHSLRGARRLVHKMLHKGDAPALKIDGDRIFVATRELLQHYGDKINETSLGRELGHVACRRNSERETCDGRQRRGYWLPALAAARSNWSRGVGIKVQWPEDDGHWECVEAEPIL